MDERRGTRLVTQRHLELESPVPPSTPVPEPPPEPVSSSPPPGRPPDRPIPPSNTSLLDRQLRWQRERGKFEAGHAVESEPK
jgi:hypothetical protein